MRAGVKKNLCTPGPLTAAEAEPVSATSLQIIFRGSLVTFLLWLLHWVALGKFFPSQEAGRVLRMLQPPTLAVSQGRAS